MEHIINKAVVFDYFSGNVTPLQKKSVELWLAEANNRAYYYQWLHEWELAHPQTNTDWQQAFERTAGRLSEPFLKVQPGEPIDRRSWLSWGGWKPWLMAATLVLVLVLGSWLFRNPLRYQTVRTGYGETRTLTLSDGSVVTLNANSSVRYPRFGFGHGWLAASTNTRTVQLTGEADFSVRHLPNHQQFVVTTPKGLQVTVLGTEFTVMSRARKTQVVLRSGKVELTLAQRASQQPLTMRPGDLVTLGRGDKLALRRTAHPEAAVAWKNHRFTFEQTSLREVAALLEENYGLTVVIDNPDLASRTVSGSFPARNADEILKLMAELLEINYIRDNNRVTFTD